MKAKKSVALVALSAAVALTLAACGGGSSGSSSSGSDDNGAVLPGSAMVTAKYSDLKDGGTLTQAVSQLPYNYNQLNAADGLGDTLTIEAPAISQTGTTVDSKGQWKIDPDYITSAKLISTSPQKVAVKLNPKAVWSDGKPITYEDMVNYWKAFNGSNSKYQVLSTNGFQDISSITKGSDDYSYTITYKKKNADWPNYMYPGLPSVVTSTPAAFNTGYEKKMYPSNGPFVISKIDTNAGVVTETPNPKWWGKTPKLDKVIFRVVDQSSQGQAFANKEIDVLDTEANADTLDQAKNRTDATIEKSGGLTWTNLTFNGKRAPLNNVHVRKAVAMAIDRETMVNVIQKPLGVKPTVQNSVVYVPGQAGYEDIADKVLPYSLSKSAAELKLAGYTKGSDGYYQKDGKDLSMSITVPSDTPTNAQRAQLIQGFLKKAGIKLTLDTVPTAKYFSDYILKLNYDLTSFSWQGTPFPVSTTESIFYPADAGQNFTGITDSNLGALWDKANGELNPTKQQALVHDIDKAVYDYVPILTIGTTPTIWAVKKGIANIGATQFLAPTFDYSIVGYTK